MSEMQLIEALTKWSSGKLLDGDTIHGISVLYWGRIGKILEAIATLFAVVDLIGEEKLRRLGNASHEALLLRRTLNLLKGASLLVLGGLSYCFFSIIEVISSSPRGPGWIDVATAEDIRARGEDTAKHSKDVEKNEAYELMKNSGLEKGNKIITAILSIATGSAIAKYGNAGFFEACWFALGSAVPIYFSLAPLALVILAFIGFSLHLLVSVILLYPLTYALSREHIERTALATSLLIFCIGFSLDLLAS